MFDFFGRRDLLSAASLICIAYVVALAASSSSAANIAYRDPSNPALPKAGAGTSQNPGPKKFLRSAGAGQRRGRRGEPNARDGDGVTRP